jgi:hypothetical protein
VLIINCKVYKYLVLSHHKHTDSVGGQSITNIILQINTNELSRYLVLVLIEGFRVEKGDASCCSTKTLDVNDSKNLEPLT